MQKYCLGFAFNESLTKVVLIRKNTPEWQAGKLNGVGGKVENNETYIQAMCREFYEEAGLLTKKSDWAFVINMMDYDKINWAVNVYTTKLIDWDWLDIHSVTSEKITILDLADHTDHNYVNEISHEFIDNIDWLVSICKNVLRGGLRYGLSR